MAEYVNPVLDTLEPREVFSKFRLLTAIPRGSGNEKGVSDFLRDWAKERGFPVRQDEAYNLFITKPGQKAASDAPPVILQAHLDMVCASTPEYDFDFQTQPITVIVDGDKLRADRTTLGADDGIGVAYALALLESTDISHPPLEVVFTTDEETGMTGAAAFDVTPIKGATFINIDFEEEGLICASCAGGVRLDLSFPIGREPLSGADAMTGMTIDISGLAGGHSGVEIDKERGNSHRLMARVLRQLALDYDIGVHDISGGVADNAIPSQTIAVAAVMRKDVDAIAGELKNWENIFRTELAASDGVDEKHLVTIKTVSGPVPENVLTDESFDKMMLALFAIPTGVAAMDMSLPKESRLPESSSNLAIVNLNDREAMIRVSLRSQLASRKAFLRAQIETIAKTLGAKVAAEGDYPGWEFDSSSQIRPLIASNYEKLAGKAATVVGIHAGLECGLFSEHMRKAGKKVDFAAIGPDLREVHTPQENLSISSTATMWALLKNVMADMAGCN